MGPEEKLEKLLIQRSYLELWLDKHNHKMELIRTFGSLIAAITGLLVFVKVFGFI
jgi:hypothetical protein